MKKNTTLYNVIFPVWMLAFIPVTWLVVLPANFAIDLLVLRLAMGHLGLEDRKARAKTAILKVWLLGFAADIVGAAGMFAVNWLDLVGEGWSDLAYHVCYQPFGHLGAFLWVAVCVAASAVLIWFFNNSFALKKSIPETEERHKTALVLAVVTAPWLFFLPTAWFF